MNTEALVATSAPSPGVLTPAHERESTEALGEQIAALAMQLHAATYELLTLLREFDQRRSWHGVFASCAHWLHWRTGIDLGAAREKVRVAHALAALPLLSVTMRRGATSYAKVRAITRVATPANEAELLTFAQAGTAAHVELAEAALVADLDHGTAGDRYQVMLHIDVPAEQLVAAGESLSGSLEVDHGAVDVSAESSRRMSCDASLVEVRHSPGGAVLDVGRKARTVPPSIRRALRARDRSCRFPGCTSCRCDAHHIEHWFDGGPTSLDDLVLLCRRHHRSVHEGLVDMRRLADGALTFIRPDGLVLLPVPHPPPVLTRLEASRSMADDLPTWDGTPFDIAYSVEVLYTPPAADPDLALLITGTLDGTS